MCNYAHFCFMCYPPFNNFVSPPTLFVVILSDMNVSRHFLIVVAVLLTLGAGAYYLFSKINFFERAKAENLSPLDTYLLENYSFTFNLQKRNEEAVRIYCDPNSATTTTSTTYIAYPCQNQNPAHKIIIGWSDADQTYSSIMKSLGDEALYFKNYGTTEVEDGSISCIPRQDYKSYKNTIFGMDCTLVTVGGKKLFSSAFFLESKKNKEIKSFVVVTNTVNTTSPQKVEQELLTLFAHQKVNTGMLSFSDIFPAASYVGDKYASTSSTFSNEKYSESASYSSNTITQNSGNTIDATVCNITDLTNCYPLYCQSVTSVFNYSLNKCIEPEVVAVSLENPYPRCRVDAEIWDGSKCRPLNGNIISSNSCTIPLGESSCVMNIFWSVQFPKNSIQLKQKISSAENLILTEGKSGILSQSFSYQEEPYIVGLYDGAEKLNDGAFSVRCITGGFDSISKKCVHPQVTKVTISGEHYMTPGILNFTCKDATEYFVVEGDTGLVVATGTYFGEVKMPVVKSGNYSLICKSGEYTGNPLVRYYHAPPPPPPDINFLISPRTISKKENTLLVWDIDFPKDTCKITAKVICKNNLCTKDQTLFEDEINATLFSSSTDSDDIETSRPMTLALTTIAPSHVDVDWKATGRKTLSLLFTTDFTLSCPPVPPQKKRVYVRGGRE